MGEGNDFEENIAEDTPISETERRRLFKELVTHALEDVRNLESGQAIRVSDETCDLIRSILWPESLRLEKIKPCIWPDIIPLARNIYTNLGIRLQPTGKDLKYINSSKKSIFKPASAGRVRHFLELILAQCIIQERAEN